MTILTCYLCLYILYLYTTWKRKCFLKITPMVHWYSSGDLKAGGSSNKPLLPAVLKLISGGETSRLTIFQPSSTCSEVVSGRDTNHPRRSKQGSTGFSPKLLRRVFPKELLPNLSFHFICIPSPTSFTSHTSSTSTSPVQLQALNIYIFLTKLLQCHIHRSSYTVVLTQAFLHKSSYTGVLTSYAAAICTQEFLHRSCYAGVLTQELTSPESTSRWSTCS